jgi:opacity protein-like surface antigen
MQRRNFLSAALLIAALSSSLLAADVAGKWSAQVPGRDGQTREQVMTFVVDGAKLTGSISGMPGGDAKIEDGKVDGANVSFKVSREMGGNSVTWTYAGTLSGDELKLKREGGRAPLEFVAKRVK